VQVPPDAAANRRDDDDDGQDDQWKAGILLAFPVSVIFVFR
jgi:hypothetical protein